MLSESPWYFLLRSPDDMMWMRQRSSGRTITTHKMLCTAMTTGESPRTPNRSSWTGMWSFTTNRSLGMRRNGARYHVRKEVRLEAVAAKARQKKASEPQEEEEYDHGMDLDSKKKTDPCAPHSRFYITK